MGSQLTSIVDIVVWVHVVGSRRGNMVSRVGFAVGKGAIDIIEVRVLAVGKTRIDDIIIRTQGAVRLIRRIHAVWVESSAVAKTWIEEYGIDGVLEDALTRRQAACHALHDG
jgi:hypothetical protein